MKKCAVFGLGKMGECVAWAMTQLGYEVTGIDTDVEKCRKNTENLYCMRAIYDVEDAKKDILDVDIVISCLPYHQNYEIAHFCIYNGLKYVDLGGSVNVSQRINDLAKTHAKQPIFTDVGLAPGLVNIVACDAIENLGYADDIEMCVGGLPIRTDNILLYGITWSLEGLLNEYRDDCIVLENGQDKKIKALSSLYKVEIPVEGEFISLEGSPTSGAMAHSIEYFKAEKVKNAKYLTLRYPNHFNMIDWLINTLHLDDNTIKDYIRKTCPENPIDVVALQVQAFAGDISYEKTLLFYHDDFIKDMYYSNVNHFGLGGFSAMQKATGFTTAAIALMMVNDVIKPSNGQIYSYEDVDLERLLSVMDGLNVIRTADKTM